MKLVPLVLALVVSLMPATSWARQVALVIGNSNYASVARLDNPRNDAIAVTAALRHQGFEVLSRLDLTRDEMRNSLREFRDMADGADVALVYYAGHGIEISGRNFLIPIDARLADERDAGLEMVEVGVVLGQISGARQLKMVVLDACRNNPFVVKMRREGSGRNIGNGLGSINEAGADTLIAYAAAAGEITPDGETGGNSPFTHAFVSALAGPPTDVRRLLGRVRDDMRATVPGAAPFVYTSLGGAELIINPRSARAEPVAATQPPITPTPAKTPGRSISTEFVRIDRNGTFQDWNEFLIRYENQSDHPLYAFALEKREALKPAASDTPAVRSPMPAVAPAVVAPAVVAPVLAAPVVVVPELTRDQAARRLQTLLAERGCYRGPVDGILGRGSRRGLVAFAGEIGQTRSLKRAAVAGNLGAIIAVLEQNPDVACPVVQTARRASPDPAPKPAKPNRRKPKPAAMASGASATVRVQGSANIVTRRDVSKLIPESPSDCIGQRKKLFDCD